jgi:hypothetical protein
MNGEGLDGDGHEQLEPPRCLEGEVREVAVPCSPPAIERRRDRQRGALIVGPIHAFLFLEHSCAASSSYYFRCVRHR